MSTVELWAQRKVSELTPAERPAHSLRLRGILGGSLSALCSRWAITLMYVMSWEVSCV